MDQLERLSKILQVQNDPNVFLDDPYFMGDMFKRAYPKQREIFCSFYKGSASGPYKELNVAGGMGGGKSALGSFFIARDAFDVLTRDNPGQDYGLSSHALITLFAIAKSIDQASDTVFAEVRERMTAPFFQEFQPKIKEDIITFQKHPDVQICAGGAISAGSLMGRNVKAVVFDEITSYDETQSQRGAWQVYTRLRKSTNRFGFAGHVFAISMVWHINDIIMTLIRQHRPDTLTYEVPTWDMNPTKAFNSVEMQSELKRDPLTFWRDYGVKPYSSLESYYPDDTIININQNRINILKDSWDIWQATPDWHITHEHNYILSTDPGRRNDTFGIALLHKEKSKTIFDGLTRLKPALGKLELDPIRVRDFCLWLCKTFPTYMFITDQAALYFADLEQRVQQLGIKVINHPNVKEDHDKVKRAWFDKTLELCDFEEVRDEFKQLTVINSQKIGTPKGAIIDMVDAITRGYWASNEYLTNASPAFHLLEVIK